MAEIENHNIDLFWWNIGYCRKSHLAPNAWREAAKCFWMWILARFIFPENCTQNTEETDNILLHAKLLPNILNNSIYFSIRTMYQPLKYLLSLLCCFAKPLELGTVLTIFAALKTFGFVYLPTQTWITITKHSLEEIFKKWLFTENPPTSKPFFGNSKCNSWNFQVIKTIA